MRTLLRLLVTICALVLIGPLALVQPQSARADVTLTLDGRGFGHGIGMSQYGARGHAEAGHTYATILSTYYPGTTLGTLSDSQGIRVWIRGDTDQVTTVRAESGLSIRTSAGTAPLPGTIGGGAVAIWRLRASGGALVLEGSVAGSWRDSDSSAVNAVLDGATSADVLDSDGTVQLLTSAYREYRGSVRAVIVPGTTTDLRTVVVTTYSDYLPSVVTAEMPASWHIQALRAQAVAARTYARFDQSSKSSSAWYDTCDTTACQVFRGEGDYNAAGTLITDYTHPRAIGAVAFTSGRTLLYGGTPAFTQFSASNGGYSVQGSRPYLAAAPDPYDGYAPWRVTFTAAELSSRFPGLGTIRTIAVSRDGNGAYGGRATSVTLSGSSGSVTVTGAEFRSALGLRSTLFATSLSGLNPSTSQRDWDGENHADLIARSPGGQLYLYPGYGAARWSSRIQIGRGWQTMGLMTQVFDFSGTGKPEIIAVQRSTGRLVLYTGTGTGGFASSRVIGQGWTGFDALIGVQDWAGDGSVGLIARQTDSGRLYYYGGNGSGGFQQRVLIGTGWQSMDAILTAGDWDGDGTTDLLARHASSKDLYLYRGNGSGGFAGSARIGYRWGGMDSLVSAADWDADGNVDLIAQAATGDLWLYPTDGRGAFSERRQVGHGWTGFDLVR